MSVGTWPDALGGFDTHLRAAGRPETTIALRGYHLRRFAASTGVTGPGLVTHDVVLGFMAAHDWKPATRHSYRCTLRVFFAWAVSVGVVDVNPTDGLPGVKMTPPSPRPVPEVHYRAALLGAPDREHLMMRLAAEAGLRRAEVAQVHSSDIEPDLGGWTLTVHGKGGKVRRVPLKATLARELRALPAGFAFPGRIEGHVSPAWVGKVVSRCLPLGYSMHKLRHRFGTVVYAVDHDLFSVQDLLGHASPETTRAYVMVDPTAKRRLVEAA